ncbi:tapasin-like, partial [Corapipo altera]|uniref:tapasin-like n=1 Tax=Corapipo altera TaxID=415028 RepID=UPI000FD6318A
WVLLLLGGSRSSRPPGGAEEQEPAGGALEVSLQLPPLRPSDDGSFVCSVTAPRGHAQQVLRLRVIAPPRVSVVPSPLVLLPGVPAELRCDAVGFFPLDVGIRWERHHGVGGSRRALPVPAGDTWSSGHRRAADGSFGRSAGLRVTRAEHGDSYDCVVTHPAWGEPSRVSVGVEVAGEEGGG